MGKKIYVSVADFADKVGVSRQNILGYIDAGKITKFKRKGKAYLLNELEAKLEWEQAGGGVITKGPKTQNLDKSEKKPKQKKKDTKMSEAMFREKRFAADLKELQVKELKGELVRKKTVYTELFAMGAEIRAGLLTIPDKFIDNIRAAETRQEAHAILYSGITEALEALAAANLKLTKE